MKLVTYISTIAMPAIIFIIVLFGLLEKNKVFDIFLEGAKDGIKIVYNIFPTSGLIDLIINLIAPLIEKIHIPIEIMPLAILRPISGSASMAIATDIMNIYGVDSKIGKIASVIMGSTETTLYTIAIYTSCVKIKNTRGILIAALIGDFVGIMVSVFICNYI